MNMDGVYVVAKCAGGCGKDIPCRFGFEYLTPNGPLPKVVVYCEKCAQVRKQMGCRDPPSSVQKSFPE